MNKKSVRQNAQYRKCGEKYPFNKVDKTHMDLGKSHEYKIFEIEARKLLCIERFDIFAFLIYISTREKGMNMETATLIYRSIEMAESDGNFIEPGKEEEKNTFTNYVQHFEALIDSIKENGVDPNITLIPIDKDNILIDGLHRLSIAAYYNQIVTVIKFFDVTMTHITPEYLMGKNQFIDSDVIELMLLEYVKWNTNLYMYIFWPKFSLLADSKKKTSYNILNNNTKIIYSKKVKISYQAVRNLMLQLYMHMDWIGSIEDHFVSTYIKADEVWDKNGNVDFVLVASESLDQIAELKESIRDVCGIKLASVHSTDNYRETYLAANLIYNTNSFHHIRYSFPDKFKTSFNLISYYKTLLSDNNVSFDNYIIDSSMVLAMYGIREANDLDYLSNSDFIICTGDIESHIACLKYHNITLNDLLYNPCNYFIFNELKLLNLDRLLIFKKNRYRELKDKKDYWDIKYIIPFQRKGWRFEFEYCLIQVKYTLVRSYSNLYKAFKKILLFSLKKLKKYKFVYNVYRKIKNIF
jgi:hypothetical protein